MNQITGMNKPVTPDAAAGQSRADEIRALASKATQAQQPNVLQRAGGAIVDQAKAGFQQAKEGVSELLTPPEMNGQEVRDTSKTLGKKAAMQDAGAQVLAAGAHGVATLGKVAGGVAETATAPLAPIFKGAEKVGRKIGEAAPTSVTVPIENALERHPEIGKQATDIMNTASLAVPEEGTPAGRVIDNVGGGIVDTTKTAAQKVGKALETPPASAEPAKPAAAATKSTNPAHAAIEDEIRNTAAKYPSVGKILNAAETKSKTDPISVLSSYASGKALPTLTKGKIQVDNAVKYLAGQRGGLAKLKSQLVKSSQEIMAPEEFRKSAETKIDGMNWSQAKKDAMKKDVAGIVETIKESYPEGIPNTEMDLLKSEHQGESKSYNSKSKFALDAHGIVGQVAKELVEKNGGSAPIEELNKLIQSHFDAEKLLLAMRGKTPHGGALSRMVNNTLGEVGGFAGGMVVGHPFLGAMAGRAGAEAVTEIINNHFISNPLKRSMVNNMKGVDPEVVQKANDYLEANQSSQTQPATETTEPTPKDVPSDNDTTE